MMMIHQRRIILALANGAVRPRTWTYLEQRAAVAPTESGFRRRGPGRVVRLHISAATLSEMS
eukprot:scaffold7436_cov403-Prasinococcus_capsulatus_cf.AAC.1